MKMKTKVVMLAILMMMGAGSVFAKIKAEKFLVSENELETVKSYLLGEFLRDFDGPFALAGSFKAINDFDLDYTFYDDALKVLRNITSAELMTLAQQYLNPEDFYTVVAGSKSI
jgi:predicted Zn-dependent peptidase